MALLVARIGKAHSLRGEVTVQVHTDAPEERFTPGAAFVTDPDIGVLTLRGARVHNGTWLLSFDQSPDRTAAERLRGTRLLVAEDEEREDTDDDAWYEEDLVGFAVVLPDGTTVGEVSGLDTRPSQDLLLVRLPSGRDALVPFVTQLVPEVDEEARRVVIDPPPGLLELAEEG